MKENQQFNDAIVIGGSIGGMMAARVLANYFKRVTIIERDSLDAITTDHERMGVSQRTSAHILWPVGFQGIKRFFPNFEEALKAKGAYPAYYPDDAHTYFGDWKPKTGHPGNLCYMLCRKSLDEIVRSMLTDYANIHFIYNNEVCSLLHNFKEKRIQGVCSRNRDTNDLMNHPADLVVDASGSQTQSPEWLETLGYVKPKKDEVIINAYLLSRMYRWSESLANNWRYERVYGPCNQPGGVITRIEDDPQGKRWIVTVTIEAGGTFDFENPESEFDRVIQQLPRLDIYQLVRQGTPLSPVYPYLFPADRRFHYETMKQRPEGFMAIGDAFIALNPRHALGMNIAVLTAGLLDDALKQNGETSLHQSMQHYHKIAAKFFDRAWPITVNDSLKYLKKPVTFSTKLWNWYLGNVNALASQDAKVWQKMWNVIRLEKPFSILLHPAIFVKVLLQSMMKKS